MACRKSLSTTIYGFLFFFTAFPDLLLSADWPHWRGSDRSGITNETSGWEKGSWPHQSALWDGNVGEGASSPVIHQGKLYVIGWKNGNDVVQCLDPGTGKRFWEQSYPNPKFGRFAKGDQGMYRGATATPEFDTDTGLLFTLSCDGTLNAWNTNKAGARFWSLNLYDKFDIPRRPQITKRKNTLRDYGYTTAPLVYRDWVIVEVGDRNRGCIKAFDKWSGELRWQSQNRDPAGHTGGLVPLAVDGIPCVAVATSWNLLVVRLDGQNAGKTVAEYEWKTDFSNTIASVAVQGQDLLISSRYNQMAMARINVSLRGAKRVWKNRYPTGVCTPVIHKGKIYFANKGIHCVDFETGKLIWEGGKIGDAGSCLVTSDERLLVWGNDGDLLLVDSAERSPGQCRILAQRNKVFDDMAWPHVVIADKRIFCKTLSGDIACFSIEQTNRKEVEKPPSFSNIKAGPWPGDAPDQVIAWKQGRGIAGCVGHPRRTRLESRGRVSLGQKGQLKLEAGGYHVKGASDALLAAAKKKSFDYPGTVVSNRRSEPGGTRPNPVLFERSLSSEFYDWPGKKLLGAEAANAGHRRERYET